VAQIREKRASDRSEPNTLQIIERAALDWSEQTTMRGGKSVGGALTLPSSANYLRARVRFDLVPCAPAFLPKVWRALLHHILGLARWYHAPVCAVHCRGSQAASRTRQGTCSFLLLLADDSHSCGSSVSWTVIPWTGSTLRASSGALKLILRDTQAVVGRSVLAQNGPRTEGVGPRLSVAQRIQFGSLESTPFGPPRGPE